MTTHSRKIEYKVNFKYLLQNKHACNRHGRSCWHIPGDYAAKYNADVLAFIHCIFTAFYTLQLDYAMRLQLSTADWQRTISIADMGFGPKVKKMSAEEKQILINSGSKAVEDYFGR